MIMVFFPSPSKNTPMRWSHHGGTPEVVLSVHSPKQNLSSKELYFLRNYNHPKRGKCLRGGEGGQRIQEIITGKVIRGLLNSRSKTSSPHKSKMIRNNRTEIDHLTRLSVCAWAAKTQGKRGRSVRRRPTISQ